MIDDTYITLKRRSEGLYKEKGSKFISLAFPASTEEEIKIHLEEIKKKYYDARHHCYAYTLGREGVIFRANDDGEPNHSAGDPILGQIRSNNLTDTFIVVIRYFGGTKLGVGGLINAYKTAAAEAIANNAIIRKTSKKLIRVHFDYLAMNDVMKLVKEYNADIKEQDFGNTCKIKLAIRLRLSEELLQKLTSVENVTASVIEIDVP